MALEYDREEKAEGEGEIREREKIKNQVLVNRLALRNYKSRIEN